MTKSKNKTKIAIFDLTGCQGCEFHLLSLNELLLDFFQDFEIVNWRLLSPKRRADFDVAFIEGAVTNKRQIKFLKKIRETSKIVVAFGACAVSGNIFSQPEKNREKWAKKIYGEKYHLQGKFLEPVEKFIKVDKQISGCPPDIEIFKNFLKELRKEKVISKIKEVIIPNFTAKIEGHGILKINLQKKKVKFEAEENERLVEGLVLGKNFNEAPFIVSRICGICPVAHNLCSWLAIENALGIKVPDEIIILRKILLGAQIIKSHVLHLFFLVLPDYEKSQSAIGLFKKYPAEFHLMLNLKRTVDEILKIIGGSSTFPFNPILGGFRKLPEMKKLLASREAIFEVIDEAFDLIKLFNALEKPKLKTKPQFLSSNSFNSYPLYPVKLKFSIKEIIRKDSPAKIGVLKEKKFVKTGAIARLAQFSQKLNPQAQKILKNISFDPYNPFSNNLAQAVEILHFLEEIIKLIEKLNKINYPKNYSSIFNPLKFSQEKINFKKENFGYASIEAPRGVLIHQLKINSFGKIIDYNIISPTQINLASLEKEANVLIKNYSFLSFSELKKQIESLIRALDPCITCAVH